ncbi:MAG TPA: hypothetical protein VFD36_29390 [Kofleriaceae bacterium]|nr:hypothetical protein [Kofleriaceae bacterium]
MIRALFDVTSAGHTAYRDIIDVLGPCEIDLVGWCVVDLPGKAKGALVVTQKWPFLPFGTDPAKLKKARKFVAVIPAIDCFEIVEVQAPSTAERDFQRLMLSQAATP